MTETLWMAAILGVITMPHCLMMCGPVAAVACKTSSRQESAAYIAGRLCGYAMVGSLMGWMGTHAFVALGTDVMGRIALVAVALTCLWHAWRAVRPARAKVVQLKTKRSARPLASVLFMLIPKRGVGLGMATAVFPCGALPAAWAIAAASAHPARGAAAMVVFALASSPALLLAIGGGELGRLVSARVPRLGRAAIWVIVASVLFARAFFVEAACHG